MQGQSRLGLVATAAWLLAACSATGTSDVAQDPNNPNTEGGVDAGTLPDGAPRPNPQNDGGKPEDDAGPTPSATYDCKWGVPVFTKLAPSTSPPGGLALSNVPQFVAFGFDDNLHEDGMKWAVDLIKSKMNPAGRGDHCTFDGTAARFTFFVTSKTDTPQPGLKALHARAYKEGNEIGNHTDTHDVSLQANSDKSVWLHEIDTCNGFLTGLGVPRAEITGFRTPFLQYTSSTFAAMSERAFRYDCSIEHFLSATGEDWPYTLDNGQSTNSFRVNDGPGNRPGLWELPVHEFMPATGWAGVTGLDYNIWCAKKMDPASALSLLKASLDLRFKGDNRAVANRAPLFVGAHTDLYSTANADAATCANTVQQRRQVIEQFLDYALHYDPAVRVVPYEQILRWMQHPIGLDGTKGH